MSLPALNQPGSMDYSAVTADPALSGSSPWGSSSPQANRSGFSGRGSDGPDSPVAAPRHQHTHSQDSISANPFASEPGTPALPQPQPSSPDIQAARETIQDESAATLAQSPIAYQQQTQPQIRPGAARYHNARQSRPVPTYKLQAKVTALERTGRKDPIIRFDVYVSDSTCRLIVKANRSRQTCRNSERLNLEMSVEPIPSLSSWPNTSFPPIPKPSFLLFHQVSPQQVLALMKTKPELRVQYRGG